MRKLILALGLLGLGFWSSPAWAVACSGTSVHGSGNHACYAIAAGTWSTTTVWSATSGGASCGCTIQTGDELIFDIHTPTGTYGTIAISLAAIDATAAVAGVTISGASGVTISGLFFGVSSAMTFTANGTWTFTSTSGTTVIETGGQSLATGIIFNGAGGTFVPGGDGFGFTATATPTLTAGTFDNTVNNINVTVPTWTGATGGTVKCGTGTWTFNSSTGTLFQQTAGTVTCSSGIFDFTSTTATNNRTFQTLNATYGALNITGIAIPGYMLAIVGTAGGPTFGSMTIGPSQAVVFSTGITFTFTATPQLTGTAALPIFLNGGADVTTKATLAVAAGTAPNWSYVALQNITITGNTSGVCNNCFDLGGNSGITIHGPSGGGGIIGG